MDTAWLVAALILAGMAAGILYRHFRQRAPEARLIAIDTVLGGLLIAAALLALARGMAP